MENMIYMYKLSEILLKWSQNILEFMIAIIVKKESIYTFLKYILQKRNIWYYFGHVPYRGSKVNKNIFNSILDINWLTCP
jgi:hypothetical protein